MQTRARHIGPRVQVLNFLSRFSMGKFKNRLAGTKPPPLGRTPLGPRPQAPVALSGPFRSPWAPQRPPSCPPRAPSRRRRALAYPGPRALAYPGPREQATYVVEKGKIYIYILSHVHLSTGFLLLRTAYLHKAYITLLKQPTPLYS